MSSNSPVPKRLKLDPSSSPSPLPVPQAENAELIARHNVEEQLEPVPDIEHDEDEHCVICLHHIRDRTVLPCAHDRLCFDCIFLWCQQSRKCPLCNASIGPFLIHNFRSKYDYSKYYLHPLHTSPPPSGPASEPIFRPRDRTRGQPIRWGTRGRINSASREREDEFELAVQRRRWVYRHGLYAKHVASNPYTRYRPAPTPAQISSSQDLISRATIFVRRELRVWINLDVEFLTTFILSLMKSLDLRSESAVKLLAEFLDMDQRYYVGNPDEPSAGRFTNSEHFSHELYSYLRSPFRDLAAYDLAVQYDTPSEVPSPPPGPPERPRGDVLSSRNAEPSSRRHRKRSSPSPLSRSPRDVHSRSPSPTYSDHINDYSRSRSSDLESDLQRHRENYGRAGTNNKHAKGKGKALPHSRTDTWRPHRDENRTRGRSSHRRYKDSAEESPVTSDIPPPSSPLQKPARRSPSIIEGPDSFTRRGPAARSEIGDSHSNSPPPPTSSLSLKVVHDANEGENVPSTSSGEKHGSRDNEPYSKAVDHQPEVLDASWGISIKGQAKLLDQNREVTRETPDLHRKGIYPAPEPTRSIPKKRSRNASVFDMLQAHMGAPSSTRQAGLGRRASIGTTKNNLSEASGEDVPILDNRTASQRSSSVAAPQPEVAPTLQQRSAREIMARTRAKQLANKESAGAQRPHIGVVSAGPPDGSSSAVGDVKDNNSTTTSRFNSRSRLMRRLEEEKLRAVRDDDDGFAFHGDQSSSDRQQQQHGAAIEGSSGGGIQQKSEVEDPTSNSESGSATATTAKKMEDSRKVETKLRAQALLRVRLAAEKRKVLGATAEEAAEEIGVSREELLRAKLLSRRGDVSY